MIGMIVFAFALSAQVPEALWDPGTRIPRPSLEAAAIVVDEKDGSHTLIHEAVVNAPISQVWDAISTPEGWRGWAVPVARTVDGNPDLLETSYDKSAAPAGPGTIRQLFVARIPGRMLAFRTVKAPEGFADFETFAKVVNIFELEAMGPGRTRVTLTGSPYPDTEAGRRLLAMFARGNRLSLDMLERRFARGPIDWSRKPERQ
jgi:uncharacterized protein YndB with AHSA1/START domain